MEQKLFIVINAIVVGAVLLFFIRGRKKDEPSRLNLNSQGKLRDSSPYQEPEPDNLETRSVNVIFQYNGHSWDAFEVLGIPAGSNKMDAERAFDKLNKGSDAKSREFYKAAVEAIRKS